PMERKRLREARLLIPADAATLAETPRPRADAVVVPIPVEPSGPTTAARDITAVTYAADPQKKGLGVVLDAWERAAGEGDTLVVAGLDEQRAAAYCEVTDATPGARRGVRFAGNLDPAEFRALLRRARIFVTAPRREDYGMAQLEALADGCVLVTTPAPGPYAALPIARELDLRLVTDDLARALRIALDDPMPDYAARAAEAVRRFHPDAVDRMVVERLLPRLLP
ncbi:MAG TPA: glycosyltransferase, partial [Solirubrobacteraceae bacterium]